MFIPPPDFTPDFSKAGGLVAAVAQDAASGEVLMLAWMDRTAWEATLATGEAPLFQPQPPAPCGTRGKVRATCRR